MSEIQLIRNHLRNKALLKQIYLNEKRLLQIQTCFRQGLIFLAFVLLLSTALLVPWVSIAKAQQILPAAQLQEYYKKRVEQEILARASVLDKMNLELSNKIPDANAEVLQMVNNAWKEGKKARKAYWSLVTVINNYKTLSDAYGLPFKVSEDLLQIRRWEALRPLLAPDLANLKNQLGWEDPAGDNPGWCSKIASLHYEILLLCKWLLDPPDDARNPDAAREWVKKELALDWMEKDIFDTGREHLLLHGQYRYVELKAPTLADTLPPRANLLLQRLSLAPEKKKGGTLNFLSYVCVKDAFLMDLLGIMLHHDGELPSPIDAWYNRGARFFPPFTLFQPEAATKPGTVRAVLARDRESTKLLRKEIKTCGIGTDPILHYQVTSMKPDRTIEFPKLPWTSWTPVTTCPAETGMPWNMLGILKNQASKEDVPEKNAEVSEGTEIVELPPPEFWPHTSAWVASQVTAQQGLFSGSIGVQIKVRPWWWRLAVREADLVDSIKNKIRLNICSGDGNDHRLNLLLTVARPGEQIHATLSMDGHPLKEKIFYIAGPWPAWFAASLFPSHIGLDTVMLFWAAPLLMIFVLYRLFNQTENYFQGLLWLPFTCTVLGITAVVIAWIAGPDARPCPKIGGVVEIQVPGHDGLIDEQRDMIRAACRATHSILTKKGTNSDTGSAVEDMWCDRWKDFFLSLWPPWNGTGRKRAADNDAQFSNLEFRIRPYSWSLQSSDAPVFNMRAQKFSQEHFLNLVDHALNRGGEAEAPLAFTYGASGDAHLSLVFCDGDHGSLIPPSQKFQNGRKPQLTLSLCGLSRDGQPERYLRANKRREWIAQRSINVLCPFHVLEHAPLSGEELDKWADAPADMDRQAKTWWHKKNLSKKEIEHVGEVFAQEARKTLENKSQNSTRTALGEAASVFHISVYVLGLSALLSLVYCAAIQHCGFALNRTKIVRLAGWNLAVLLVLALLLATASACSDYMSFTYSGSLMNGLSNYWWWLAGMFFILGIIRMLVACKQKQTQFSKCLNPQTRLINGTPSWRLIEEFALSTIGIFCATLAMANLPIIIIADSECPWWLPADFGGSMLSALGLFCLGVTLVLVPAVFRRTDNDHANTN